MKNLYAIAVLAGVFFLSAKAESVCLNDAELIKDESVGVSIKREIFQFRENPNAAQKFINARLYEKYELHKKELKKMFAAILADENYDGSAAWSLFAQSKVCVNTPKFFSAKNSYYIYSGGANGMSFEEGFNFEISGDTTKEIKLSELFSAKLQWKTRLLELALKSVSQNFPDVEITLSKSEIQDPEALGKVSSGFVLHGDEMEILFPKYSIACGAAGCMFAKIKYSELEEYFSERGRSVIEKIGRK